MKTRQNNDMIDYIGVVYVVNETELSWSIKSGAIYDENHATQWRDVRIEPLKSSHDVMLKMKLSYHVIVLGAGYDEN